ncbi:MAG: glycosyltransferase, partial [Candidatus Dadabacteria bacterium]
FDLARTIISNRINVVHSHDLGSLIYAALARVLSGFRVRHIHTQHSFVGLTKNRKEITYHRLFSWLASKITVVNADMKRIYRVLGVPDSKISVVENAVELGSLPVKCSRQALRSRLIKNCAEGIKTRLKPYVEDKWILHLARIHPAKGQLNSIAIWEALSETVRSKAVLIIAGYEAQSGELERVRSRALESVDAERILIIPGTDSPAEWIRAADIYLSPSNYEGRPLGPIEAIMAEVPVVVSKIPGHRFLNNYSEQFSLLEPDRAASLVESIFKSLADQDFKLKLAECRKSVSRRYSAARMVREYLRLYRGGEYAGYKAEPGAEACCALAGTIK